MKSFKNTQLHPETLYLPKNIRLCCGMCNISEFLLHMAYLGFIFSLIFTCCSSGLCVVWRQRHCFQTSNSVLWNYPGFITIWTLFFFFSILFKSSACSITV